jgi:tRNA dimethylallyltransferase
MDTRHPGESPVHCLVGPTASGKSEVAVEVAERAGAEILSMDSMLVYRGMDIGTAKPTAELTERVPHHLMDLVGPEESFSVQRWLAEAERVLADVQGRGARALFVGGTAFFLRALLQGLFDGPPVDPVVRAGIEARVDEEGLAALHAELERVDPPSAARIHPNDRKRVVRALEVLEQTGRPLSSWQQEWGWHAGEPPASRPHTLAGLRLETGELDRRIRARTAAMLDAGWLEEAVRLRANPGLGPTACQALGYAEVLELADGAIGREVCEERIALRTRQFARRQRTWLRRFDIGWVEAQEKDPRAVAAGVMDVLGWSA